MAPASKAPISPPEKPGPGVLLLHQCNRQRKVWDDLAARLAAAGFHAMTVDLRGYGDSSGTPWTNLLRGNPVVFAIKSPPTSRPPTNTSSPNLEYRET